MTKLKLTPVQAFKAVQARKALAEILEELKAKKLTGDADIGRMHLQTAEDHLAEFMGIAATAGKAPASPEN
jgi:hypothetical protein